ncbi:MAG: DUF2442 domain-containing protein [Fibromonadaceae bacterium]|jgi:hypothetical protein|nr:DUF2442 domain-containing protein [Fibromonadaceae bacterium]
MLQHKIKLVKPVEPFSLFLEYETNGYGVEWANGQDIAPHELYENSVFCV